MSCGADTTANALLSSLLQGKSFELPEVDLNDDKFEIPDDTDNLMVLSTRSRLRT